MTPCRTCGKPLTGRRNGRECRDCENARRRANYARNRDRELAKSRALYWRRRWLGLGGAGADLAGVDAWLAAHSEGR